VRESSVSVPHGDRVCGVVAARRGLRALERASERAVSHPRATAAAPAYSNPPLALFLPPSFSLSFSLSLDRSQRARMRVPDVGAARDRDRGIPVRTSPNERVPRERAGEKENQAREEGFRKRLCGSRTPRTIVRRTTSAGCGWECSQRYWCADTSMPISFDSNALFLICASRRLKNESK